MNQKATLELSCEGMSTPIRPTKRPSSTTTHISSSAVLVRLQVGEQLVGGDGSVVVTVDLAVDEVANPHHLDGSRRRRPRRRTPGSRAGGIRSG